MTTNRDYNPNDPTNCSFCGDEIKNLEGGQWHTNPPIFCCPRCALTTLPKLIADSVDIDLDPRFTPHEGWSNPLSDVLIEIERGFVRAMQIRLKQHASEIEQLSKDFGQQFAENRLGGDK